MPRDALILIDIQNDFLPGGALAVSEGEQVIPVANRMQEKFDLVLASRDWHPRDHGSFAANHPGRQVGEVIDLHGLRQVLWPVHCVQETPGAEFSPALNAARLARVFLKGTDADIDSYSALFDNGHRRSTGLADYLREQGVHHVHLLGLATDYCVKFTVLDARSEGFHVTLIEDGCRGVNLAPSDSSDAIEEMRRAGCRIVHSSAIHV